MSDLVKPCDQEAEIRLPAIEVKQSPTRILYTFAVDGKLVPAFATISRIRRQGLELEGYQRPEILSHIDEIRSYLDSADPMIPNSVVVAFDSRVRFTPTGPTTVHGTTPGELAIPLQSDLADHEKPGFIVDGQQRLAAIRESRVSSFPICVTAFITDDAHVQTEQFILVNSTKPLPKGLIYELLPTTEGHLPSLLRRRRLPAYLVHRLNSDDNSPFKAMVRTPTNPEGVVQDNSLLRMIENSVEDGTLYRFRSRQSGSADTTAMLSILTGFWRAVSLVFPEAWGQNPRRSRLMHGAGIVSLGFVMDAIGDHYREARTPSDQQFVAELQPLASSCRWTNGHWDFGPGQQRKWNEIQNTSRDIHLLSNYLLVQYRAHAWPVTGSRPVLGALVEGGAE